jgi:hypothetical protein
MQTFARSTVPRWFWIVAAAAILWNLLGVVAYIMDVTISEEALAALPDDQRALYEGEPAWATGAYAVAVFGGLLGSILLALRRRLAAPVLVVSLAAVLVQIFEAFALSDTLTVIGPSSVVLPAAIIAIGVGLAWFSFRARNLGWLR